MQKTKGPTGIEPVTCRSAVGCSTTELRARLSTNSEVNCRHKGLAKIIGRMQLWYYASDLKHDYK